MRAAASCESFLAMRRASAKPTPCSPPPGASETKATKWSSVTSSRTAGRDGIPAAGIRVDSPSVLPYRGATLREFDLDAALARHPQLILVDELAHTNAEGARHAKRWQDVEELLEAGIDVWTTLNVQHVESLNDVIAQITGVVVRETLARRRPGTRRRNRIDRYHAGRADRAAASRQSLHPAASRTGAGKLFPEEQPGGAARAVAAAGRHSPAPRC